MKKKTFIILAAVPLTLGAATFVTLPTNYGFQATEIPNAAVVVTEAGMTDAQVIQRAIDEVAYHDQIDVNNGGAVINSNLGAGTVYIPRGVYCLDEGLRIPPGVRLVGAGATGSVGSQGDQGTILYFDPINANPENRYAINIVKYDAPLTQNRLSGVSNIKIIAAPETASWLGAIRLEGAWGATIEDVTIEGFFRGNHETHEASDMAISGDASLGKGILLSSGSFYNVIRRCRISDCNAGVFYAHQSQGNIIEDTTFAGQVNSAVYSHYSSDNRLSSCDFDCDITYALVELGTSDAEPSNAWNIVGCRFPASLEAGEVDLAHVRSDLCLTFMAGTHKDGSPDGVAPMIFSESAALDGQMKRLTLVPIDQTEAPQSYPVSFNQGETVCFRCAVPHDWNGAFLTNNDSVFVELFSSASTSLGTTAGQVSLDVDIVRYSAGEVDGDATPKSYSGLTHQMTPGDATVFRDRITALPFDAGPGYFEITVSWGPSGTSFDGHVDLEMMNLLYVNDDGGL